MNEIAHVRLPRSGRAWVKGGDDAPKWEPLRASRLTDIHAMGRRGKGTRVAIVGDDFRGWEKLPGKPGFVDLTAERNRDLQPDPEPGGAGEGFGTRCARALIAEIGRGTAAGSSLSPCSHRAGGGSAGGATVDAVIPAGVYRKTVTEEQLLAAGASPTAAKTNGGTWTLTVTEDGYQSFHIDSPYPEKTVTCDKRKMYIAQTASPRPAERARSAGR